MQEPRVNQLQRSLSCTLVEHLTPLRVCIVFFIYAIGLLALYATTWPKEGVSGVAGNIDDVEVARERWLVNILTNMTAYCFILFPLLLLRWLSEPLLNLWQSDKRTNHDTVLRRQTFHRAAVRCSRQPPRCPPGVGSGPFAAWSPYGARPGR
uniref:Uncharacterized protein n=1 Tax=Schistocephalus solidus TaxID=70667 RepID=A0A0V0J6U2_SCHSO